MRITDSVSITIKQWRLDFLYDSNIQSDIVSRGVDASFSTDNSRYSPENTAACGRVVLEMHLLPHSFGCVHLHTLNTVFTFAQGISESLLNVGNFGRSRVSQSQWEVGKCKLLHHKTAPGTHWTSQIEDVQLCKSIQRKNFLFMQFGQQFPKTPPSLILFFHGYAFPRFFPQLFLHDESVGGKCLVKPSWAIFLDALLFVLFSVFLNGSLCQQPQQGD